METNKTPDDVYDNYQGDIMGYKEAFNAGYSEGIRDAVAYLAELYEGVYDTDVFARHDVPAPEQVA